MGSMGKVYATLTGERQFRSRLSAARYPNPLPGGERNPVNAGPSLSPVTFYGGAGANPHAFDASGLFFAAAYRRASRRVNLHAVDALQAAHQRTATSALAMHFL